MSTVYSRAICNIAATNAGNATIGLCSRCIQKAVIPFWIEAQWPGTLSAIRFLVLPGANWDMSVSDGILNTRAWILQGGFLSARTLHFTRLQVIWECYEEQIGEVFAQSNNNWKKHEEDYSFRRQGRTGRIKRLFRMPDTTMDDDYLNFYYGECYCLRTYSLCSMTKEKDKLVAIQGTMKKFSEATGYRFVTSLWRSRMLECLL